MVQILVFLTRFNWLLIPQFIFGSLLRARWKGAYADNGPIGILSEGFGSALGLNSTVFYVDIYGRWSGHKIQRLLASYKIPVWGWGFEYDFFYFRVPVEDEDLAYNVLISADVELVDWY